MTYLRPSRLIPGLLLAAAIAAAVLWWFPSDQYLIEPDPAHLATDAVLVPHPKPDNDGGGIFYVDVIIKRASLFESIFPQVHSGASLVPADKRGQVLQFAGTTVINDCYNSNPKALDAMVDALAAMKAKRRIVVAGEMLELGAMSPDLHRASGNHIAQRKIDILIGVRGQASFIVEQAAAGGVLARFFHSPEEAGDWLGENLQSGDVILLKASRGVKLERALERLQEKIESKKQLV